MNNKHVIEICKFFDLGFFIGELERVYGGLNNTMWRVNTDKNSYAVRQLSQDIDLRNKKIRDIYEFTERVAYGFAQKRSVFCKCHKKDDKHVIEIDETFFLVYPWINANILKKDTISYYHAIEIAKVVARLHSINLNLIEGEDCGLDNTNEGILDLISKAETLNCSFADKLRKNESNLIWANSYYQDSIPLLKKSTVISHGDLDINNILWEDSKNPILIDWESARKLNPEYDFINTFLHWSGFISEDFDEKLFIKMIHVYVTTGGKVNKGLLKAAFGGVLGNFVNWLTHNIKRSFAEKANKVSIEQISKSVLVISNLKNSIPRLIKIIYNSLI